MLSGLQKHAIYILMLKTENSMNAKKKYVYTLSAMSVTMEMEKGRNRMRVDDSVWENGLYKLCFNSILYKYSLLIRNKFHAI